LEVSTVLRRADSADSASLERENLQTADAMTRRTWNLSRCFYDLFLFPFLVFLSGIFDDYRQAHSVTVDDDGFPFYMPA